MTGLHLQRPRGAAAARVPDAVTRGSLYLVALTLAACAADGAAVVAPAAPYEVAPGLFDAAAPDLGLRAAPGTGTVTIFRARDGGDTFSNGVVLMPFKGRLYAQWQSSARDEDSADTWVAYSSSEDGSTWTSPGVLAAAGSGGRMHSSGGWWTDGEVLVAYINVWPDGFQSGAGGFAEYRLSADGATWSEPRRVLGADARPVEGIIEQDPHALPGGRIVAAFHLRPGVIVAPFYTDDSRDVHGWTRARITLAPHDGKMSREIEPSFFVRGRCVVMVLRDQASTYRQLAAQSCDAAVTWTTPVLTNMPDARAKQSAGNLPDGSAFLVNAPRAAGLRVPLAITLSADGRHFDRAFLVRGAADLQPLRYPGRYKRPGFHYPKSVLFREHLYIAYATNKEDVELTRIPLSSLTAAPQGISRSQTTD